MKLELPYDYLLLSQCPFRRKETHRKVCLFSAGGGRIRFSAKRHIQTGEGEDGFVTFAPCGSKLRSCRHRAGGKQGSTGALHLIIRIRPQYKKSNTRRCWTFRGGGGRIRTIEAIRSRFTVCPLWPLGNSPIFNWLDWSR